MTHITRYCLPASPGTPGPALSYRQYKSGLSVDVQNKYCAMARWTVAYYVGIGPTHILVTTCTVFYLYV